MRYFKLFTASVAVLALTACLDSDNDSPPFPDTVVTTGQVRVVHASADAPLVNIKVDGSVFNNLTDVDYQVASGLIEVNRGTYTLGVEAITPAGTADVLSRLASIDTDRNYNVVALGSVAAGTLELAIVSADDPVVGDDMVAVQILHGAPEVPMVDIYVTAPDADLASAQPLATASYLDNTGLVEVASGDYQIRLTLAGTQTVAFDSGTVTLPGGENLFVTAVPTIVPGDSPVQLLVATSGTSFVINDMNTRAALRAIHAVADAPVVDVIANNALTLFDGAPFLGVTDYANVDAGTYLVDIAADADNSVVVVDDASIMLEAGKFYTAIAHNDLANIAVDLPIDMPRRVATEAKVRIFHASPAAGPVDIYVTATSDLTGATPAFTNVPFASPDLAETGYVPLTPGDYVVTVTPTGSTDIALQTGTLSLMGGMIYTALAVDSTGGGAPVQLILADDFVN